MSRSRSRGDQVCEYEYEHEHTDPEPKKKHTYTPDDITNHLSHLVSEIDTALEITVQYSDLQLFFSRKKVSACMTSTRQGAGVARPFCGIQCGYEGTTVGTLCQEEPLFFTVSLSSTTGTCRESGGIHSGLGGGFR